MMEKDYRKKGCPNVACERHEKKIRLRSTEKYCPLCGTPLVYVCAKCFDEIEDIGPKHNICLTCEAKKDQVRENTGKNARRAASAVGAVAASVGVAFLSGVTKEASTMAVKGGKAIVKGALKIINKG